MSQPHCLPVDLSRTPTTTLHRIWSVSSYERAFPDLNDVQMATAERLGNPPVKDRQEASRFGHDKLVYVGGNPFYHVKKLDERGLYLIHPFNNLDVIAGQGTIAVDLYRPYVY